MSLIDDFRNGKRYGTDWKAPTVQHMNNLVETISINDLITKSISSTVDTSEANNYGTASVAMVGEGTNKYLKFKNLKGKGIKSITYTSTDSAGNRIYTVTLDDNSTYTIQTDKGAGYTPRGAWSSGVAYVRNANTIDTVFYNGSSYYCKVSHTSSSSILPTNTDYWDILAEKGQAPDIVDNLTTNDTAKALSANQGRVLKKEIDNIKDGTTTVGNATKVAGVDLTASTTSRFGDYVISRRKTLFSGEKYVSAGNTGTYDTGISLPAGGTFEVHWRLGASGHYMISKVYLYPQSVSGATHDFIVYGFPYGDSSELSIAMAKISWKNGGTTFTFNSANKLRFIGSSFTFTNEAVTFVKIVQLSE